MGLNGMTESQKKMKKRVRISVSIAGRFWSVKNPCGLLDSRTVVDFTSAIQYIGQFPALSPDILINTR
jgi:hypothetical protein